MLRIIAKRQSHSSAYSLCKLLSFAVYAALAAAQLKACGQEQSISEFNVSTIPTVQARSLGS